ncbi:MAG: transcriptional regulator [Candidatus Goldiibacteriota bacterium HGW-Goldbacteria-1]|nr:MAG: transcriptional regulator [Candidatus Goldiibacteriota bacterium HGW-Goldbacteria-1]
MTMYEMQAEQFKALSHPSRVKIIQILSENNCCVTNLAKLCGEPQPQTSRHLGALKKAGILICEKKGTKTCYKASCAEVFKMVDAAGKIAEKRGLDIAGGSKKKKGGR